MAECGNFFLCYQNGTAGLAMATFGQTGSLTSGSNCLVNNGSMSQSGDLFGLGLLADRAGVGHVADKYINDLEKFMSEVRRERAVELAYEGHRFNDLRRWLLLTRAPYNVKTAIYFERDGAFDPLAEPTERKIKGWKEEVLIQRNLGTKHYWIPFTTDDVTMYPEFYQNPGW